MEIDTLTLAAILILGLLLLYVLVGALVMEPRNRRAEERRKAEEEATKARYARRTCPECGEAFGERLIYIPYESSRVPDEYHFLANIEVTIICPHCRFLNIYRLDGTLFGERGMLTEGIIPQGEGSKGWLLE